MTPRRGVDRVFMQKRTPIQIGRVALRAACGPHHSNRKAAGKAFWIEWEAAARIPAGQVFLSKD
jgi:hypothetical protein